MNSQEKIMNLIGEEKYEDAAGIYMQTPKFIYKTKNPLLSYRFFEFSETANKNPVLVRILLNYICLVNFIFDKGLSLTKFHETLFLFGAKFTYELKGEGIIKLIFMAKSNIEAYNIFFKEGKKMFENDIENIIDIDEKEEDVKGIGYTFQELGRIFLNDYVIGRNKGMELPNLVFYIKSSAETKIMMTKIYMIPKELKLNPNENISYSGVNEYDNIIALNQNVNIDQHNPYFRYIKQVKIEKNISSADYDDLNMEENVLYIIEFKHAYKFNEDIASLEQNSKLYMELINKNAVQTAVTKTFERFQILYFYNDQESLGYKNFKSFNIDLNLWKFLYLNPSCQIILVIKLNREVSELKYEVKEMKNKINGLENQISGLENQISGLNNDMIEMKAILNQIIKDNPKIIVNKDIKLEGKILKDQIEEWFSEQMRSAKNKNDLKRISNELYEKYKEGINKFINVENGDILDIDMNNKTCDMELKEEIADDDLKSCFEVFVPYIGHKKASKNYYKIQKFLYKKTLKEDEMAQIYKYIYRCFFGNRVPDDSKSKEIFYKNSSDNFKNLLRNIIKYTFYYERKKEGKYYYLLVLFKELVDNGDKGIYRSIIALKHKTLFEAIFDTIMLFNADNANFCDGFYF